MLQCSECKGEFSSCDFLDNKNRCEKCSRCSKNNSTKRNNSKRISPGPESEEYEVSGENCENQTLQPRRSARLNSNLNRKNLEDADKEELGDDGNLNQSIRNIRSKSNGNKTSSATDDNLFNNQSSNSVNSSNNNTSNENIQNPTNITNYTSASNTSSNSSSNDTNNNSSNPTLNPNSDSNSNPNSDSNPSTNPYPSRQIIESNRSSPIFSFSFGFAHIPRSSSSIPPFTGLNATTVPLTSLPTDIQWMFNNISNSNVVNDDSNVNYNVEEFIRMIQRASNQGASTSATGTENTETGTGTTSSSTNASGAINASNTSTSTTTSTSPTNNPNNEMDLLGLAHQMFQLISSVRPSQASVSQPQPQSQAQAQGNPNPRILHSFISLPLSISIPAMNDWGLNTNYSSTFNVAGTDSDIENVLNEFFTRIFGGIEAAQGPVGLTSERISALPETPPSDYDFDCSICRENVKKDREAGLNGKCVQLPCKHNFHFECIDPWLRRVPSCPICRAVITE